MNLEIFTLCVPQALPRKLIPSQSLLQFLYQSYCNAPKTNKQTNKKTRKATDNEAKAKLNVSNLDTKPYAKINKYKNSKIQPGRNGEPLGRGQVFSAGCFLTLGEVKGKTVLH